MQPTVNFHDLPLERRLELSLRSPAPFFVTGEDNLQLSALNAATGVTLTLAGRFMQLDGQVTPFTHTLTPTTDRVISTVARALGDGWILNATIYASAGTPLTGQCWARLQVLRGLGGATAVIGTLVSGYVTTTQPIAFPAGQARGTLDGPGALRSITGTNPAAGAEVSETVPTGARWRLNALGAFLTPDGTVASRYARLVVDDGTNILWQSDPPAAATAGAAWRFSAGAGLDRLAGTYDIMTWGLPNDLVLLAGWRVRTLTAALQAGDNWDAPYLLVEEWIEGAA